MFCAAEIRERLQPIVGDGNAIALLGELLAQNSLVQSVVFDNQDVDV